MADGIESFNWMRNMARVAAGFTDGPFFMEPNVAPPMTVGESYPKSVDEKWQMAEIPQPTPTDPWVARYPNAKMK